MDSHGLMYGMLALMALIFIGRVIERRLGRPQDEDDDDDVG